MNDLAETPIPVARLRTVLWRRLDEPAFEHCRISEFAEGYAVGGIAIDGIVLTVFDSEPARVSYSILCGHDWTTRHAHVAIVHGRSVRQVHFRRDEENRWWRDEVHVAELDGIADIDLGITPATNTLPIRRLKLGIGESSDAVAAWVRFPDLTIERLPQRYTRERELQYGYESGGGAFTARLDVDDDGVIIRYDDLWERIAAGPATG